VQSQQLLPQRQVFEDEVLPGTERADQPPKEMPERHDHGKNLTGTVRIEFFAKSYILRVYEVSARHSGLRTPGFHSLPRSLPQRAGDLQASYHTDLIEPLSLDEAYLDVTENKTGLATATSVARTIREEIRQELDLTASAGVAPNKFLAKLASDWRKPDGLFVIQPENIDAFLLPLPVGRLPGVGKVTGEKLATLEAQTVRDLRTLDLPVLEQHFGRYGQRLHELARGIDNNPVVPDRPTQSISVEDTFEHECCWQKLSQ